METLKKLYNEWQSLQPLKTEDQKRLDNKFDLEFNYNSNHIEGNTLTYGQTKLLLIFGETTGDIKMRDLEEMKAHNVGLRWIKDIAKDRSHQLTEKDIRDLNQIILVEDFYKINPKTEQRYKIRIGEYKHNPNHVETSTGEIFQYASPEETPAMMHALIEWLNEELGKGEVSPIELASLLHYRYIRIHPFEDGNGRIARLLVTYVLQRFGYPMVIIKSDNKDEYLRILHQCDINVGLTPSDGANATLEDIAAFVEYMSRQLEWSLGISIKAAKGESIDENEDWKKILKTNFADRIAAPEISKEYKDKFVAEYLIPFLRDINEELKSFYSLFKSVKWSHNLPNSNATHYGDFSFYSERLFISDKDDYIVEISWELEQYIYVIYVSIDDEVKLSFEHRYDQPPTTDEKDEVVNLIGNLFAQIANAK